MIRVAAAAFALAALASSAFAGRPLTTEDASVIEEGRCQVEAWVDRFRDATLAWAVPACNVGLGIEWQAGGARLWEGGRSQFAEAYAQAKWLWPWESDRWAAAAVVGVVRRPQAEARGWDNPYVTVPLTHTRDGVQVHVNAGWLRDRSARRDVTTWGAALEVADGAVTWLGEAFGENGGNPFLRVGARWPGLLGGMDLDLTFVTRPGGTRAERFVSLGVFWQSARFLP